ncbi:MAG: tetratricopeptide repeat protein [Candidatus Electrothrix sp. YB6]
MSSAENNPRRIAVVVNSLTGDELKAGNRDVSRIYSLLTNHELGACSIDSPKPLHECKSCNELRGSVAPVIENWHLTDQFIFYFSGHGTVLNGRYCLQLGASSEILPFDCLMIDLEVKGVQRAIIILDACHSGAAIQGSKNSDILASINKGTIPKGIAIIASSRASQTSHEMPDGSASVFTDLLCNGIETGLDLQCTANGLISVDDIVSYISNKLKADKKYSSFLQQPVFKIDKAERPIWLAKNKSGKTSKNKTTRIQQNIRTPEELKLLYEKTVYTEHPCLGASLDDLDWSLVESYATELGEDKGDMQDREIVLTKLKFFSPLENNPTLHQSAVLCFAMYPERMYSQAKSNFVLGDQGEESFERHEVKGPLSIQIEELIRKTKQSLRKTSSIADSGKRVEQYEIDQNLIRELISNAVTHRDYRSNGVVKVTVNSDYIEIQSPGSFPGHLSWAELLKCSAYPVSKPVNGAISQYLAQLLVFEGIGRGFRIIHNYITEHGKESIKFKELPGPTTSVRILRPRDRNFAHGVVTAAGEQNIVQGAGSLGRQVNIAQDVKGDGNIFSGRAENITYHHYPRPSVPQLFPPQDDIFLHREEELTWLYEHLHPDRVVAICGPGGMGKSALAAHAVRKLPADRFSDGIVFHSFYHQPDTTMALQTIAQAFGIAAEADLEQLVRNALIGKQALLILDGTEEAEDLRAVLDLRGGCGVLITTRKKSDSGSLRLELSPLSDDQAEDMLRAWGEISDNQQTIEQLCSLLGGWPIALRLAGNYLRSTGESATDYLRWLQEEPFKELGDSEEHQRDNATLLLKQSTAQVGEDARLVLELAGTSAYDLLSVAPMTVLLEDDELRTRKAVNELVNYGLLERRGERLHIGHALIHEYAARNLPLSRKALARVASYYIAWCREQSAAGVPGYALLDDERTHCLRLIRACLDSGLWQEVKGLVEAISQYLDRQGWWTERLTALEMLLTATRKAGERMDEGECLNNLGYTCWRRGEFEQALAWHEQSLPIIRELRDRQGEGVLLNDIGNIYREQGKYEQALQYYQQSLSIRQEVDDREGAGVALNNIGQLYYYQGNYEQALQYYEQCLPVMREAGDKIGEGTTLNNIATIRRTRGEPSKALEYHQQALTISRELGDRAEEAQSCLNIGLTYHDLDDLVQAEEHIALAVEIAEAIGYPALEEWREELGKVREKRQDKMI